MQIDVVDQVKAGLTGAKSDYNAETGTIEAFDGSRWRDVASLPTGFDAGTATTLKRFQPKARGSAGPILKRRCHIKITLSDE